MQKTAYWQIPNLLSLDAVMVAICWQLFIANCFNVQLLWYHSFILGLSVWLSYVGDRWIDGFTLAEKKPLTRRHHFHIKARWPIFAAWVTLLLVDIGIAWSCLTAQELFYGHLLLILCILYTIFVQKGFAKLHAIIPKELQTAFIMTLGVFLFIWVRLPMPNGAVVEAAVYLVLLCFINCCLIAEWEYDVDTRHGLQSIRTQFPQIFKNRKFLWLASLAPIALSYLVFINQPLTEITLAFILAILALAFLDSARHRLHREKLRAAADFALLTPIIVALF